jgi:putative transposase
MRSCRQVIWQGFRFELDPNQAQRVLLAKSVGASRYVYNWGLAQSQQAYELTGRRPTLGELKAQLVWLKKSQCPWLYEVSAHIGQSALKDLRFAFERFFGGLKGEVPKAGFPKFKKKGERDSARLYMVKLEERHIWLPMVGRVRLKETRAARGFEGRIVSATIRRRADRWFVSLCVVREREIIEPKPVRKATDVVGVDFGLANAAVIHNGFETSVVEPRHALQKSLRELGKANRRVARRRKGSRNREKAKRELARLHYKISCRRHDFLHQLSSSLAKTKSVIVLEDLHVKGMARNRGLALSVGDAGFGELRRQLTYKSEWYGARLVVAHRFYPSSKTCSGCGVIKSTLALGSRIFDCPVCGLSLDRDENAAINLRRFGLAQLPEGLREVTPVKRKALASAEVKPASRKQEATADSNRRSTRRSTPKDVLVTVRAGSTTPNQNPHLR